MGNHDSYSDCLWVLYYDNLRDTGRSLMYFKGFTDSGEVI